MNYFYKLSFLPLLFTICLLGGCAPLRVPASTSPQSTNAALKPTTGQVKANGMTIAYESFGAPDDETILLIAGTGMQLVDWPLELVTELVQRGYRVVRFDNRDIGQSTKLTEAGLPDAAAIEKALKAGTPPPLPYTLKDMAADAVGLLDALKVQQAHIVGASMGGAIAQLVAIDYPERTRSLTLLMADSGDPALPDVAKPEVFANVPPQPQKVERTAYIEWQVKTWQALAGPQYPTEEATLHEWAARDFARGYAPAGFTRQGTVSLVDRYEKTPYRLNNLAKIEAPTVVLQGEADPLVPVAAAQEIAARVPHAELRLIPGLGHAIPLQLVTTFADAITTAAEQVTSTATQ